MDVFDGYDMPIKRADAVRYFYLYALGGAYIDTDFECLRPFEGSKVPLDDRRATFGLQFGTMKKPDALANSFMAAPAGHPFFAYLISQLRGAAGAAHPLDATGPRFLTSRFHQFKALAGSAAAALVRVAWPPLIYGNARMMSGSLRAYCAHQYDADRCAQVNPTPVLGSGRTGSGSWIKQCFAGAGAVLQRPHLAKLHAHARARPDAVFDVCHAAPAPFCANVSACAGTRHGAEVGKADWH